MDVRDQSDIDDRASVAKRLRAYAVHLYTASGAVLAFLAATNIVGAEPDPTWAFVWLLSAVIVDSTDGLLARRWKVTVYAPRIDGRTMDEVVDFMTFTFLPLLLVWQMDWLPEPAILWVIPPMVASLFGFSNTAAKQGVEGFFLGFPSYWNVVAFYIGIWVQYYPPVVMGVLLLVLTVLTVTPVRFLYLSRTSGFWKWVLVTGGGLWTLLLLYMLTVYPNVSKTVLWLSLSYPLLYLVVSLYKDRAAVDG